MNKFLFYPVGIIIEKLLDLAVFPLWLILPLPTRAQESNFR